MNPARSRHCHRGASPATVTAPPGAGRPGHAAIREAQETPAAVTDERGADPEEVAWSQTGSNRARWGQSRCSPPLTPTCWPPGRAARLAAGQPGPADGGRPARPAGGGRPRRRPPAGRRQAWQEGLDVAAGRGRPVVVLGGEQAPDAALMALSTVPAGVAAQAHRYLADGGAGNLRELARLPQRHRAAGRVGFEPRGHAGAGVRDWTAARRCRRGATGRGHRLLPGPRAGGQHRLRGGLCRAVAAAAGHPLPIFCGSLRSARRPGCWSALRRCDALVTHRAGGRRHGAAAVGAGGEDEAWDVGALAALDVPVLQGAVPDQPPGARGRRPDDALSPLDAATQVAIPEFDGRLIGVPFSFKEIDQDGLSRLRRRPRAGGRGWPAWRSRWPGCGTSRRPSAGSRWCCRPTRPSTPGSATRSAWTPRPAPSSCCAALRERGYDVGAVPGGSTSRTGDALIHALIAAGGQDPEWLTDDQLVRRRGADPGGARTDEWFAQLPAELRARIEQALGTAAGRAVRRPRPARSCWPRCARATSC